MYKQVMIFILANHIAVMQTEESIDGVFHSMTFHFHSINPVWVRFNRDKYANGMWSQSPRAISSESY